MGIDLDELALRIEQYSNWRFLTTNGFVATHALARDENDHWHVWYMRDYMWLPILGDKRDYMWLPILGDKRHLTMTQAMALVPNRREYDRIYPL